MYVLCFTSIFFALFELNLFFVASGASGLSNFASSTLRFTPRPLFFPLLVVFTTELSAPSIGAFCAASRVWERVRRLVGGAFDVSFALL